MNISLRLGTVSSSLKGTQSEKSTVISESRMKKFSRMPKSESGGLGGGSGSGGGTGVTNYIGKVFAVGRYQVTVDELIAEGMFTFISPQPCVVPIPFQIWGVLE